MTTTIPQALVHVLAITGPVLLDFDGPVCAFFASGRSADIANEMRTTLQRHDIAAEINKAWGPLRILSFAYGLGRPDVMTDVEETLQRGELNAASDATPTPDAGDTMQACQETGRPLVIASNNSGPGIEAYLRLHNLSHLVHAVVGRAPGRPDLMKPHPDPVNRALAMLDVPASDCVLVGDSLTDIEVAHTTGARSIAYIKSPSRRSGLLAASPDAVTQSMATLAAAIRASQPARHAAS